MPLTALFFYLQENGAVQSCSASFCTLRYGNTRSCLQSEHWSLQASIAYPDSQQLPKVSECGLSQHLPLKHLLDAIVQT